MRVVIDANTIVSGLFFRGNERRLLQEALRGAVTLLFAEDIVDEVYEVIERTFGADPDLAGAVDLLTAVFLSGERVQRESYASEVTRWRSRLSDPSDAPVMACASAVRADGVVSGDKEILGLRETEGLTIYRTRELLERLVGTRP